MFSICLADMPKLSVRRTLSETPLEALRLASAGLLLKKDSCLG